MDDLGYYWGSPSYPQPLGNLRLGRISRIPPFWVNFPTIHWSLSIISSSYPNGYFHELCSFPLQTNHLTPPSDPPSNHHGLNCPTCAVQLDDLAVLLVATGRLGHQIQGFGPRSPVNPTNGEAMGKKWWEKWWDNDRTSGEMMVFMGEFIRLISKNDGFMIFNRQKWWTKLVQPSKTMIYHQFYGILSWGHISRNGYYDIGCVCKLGTPHKWQLYRKHYDKQVDKMGYPIFIK